MRIPIPNCSLPFILGILACAAQAQPSDPVPARSPTAPVSGTHFRISMSSSSEAPIRAFVAAYAGQGYSVTQTATTTDTKSSGGWKLDTASAPMFSRHAPESIRSTVYSASVTRAGGADPEQMHGALKNCNALVSRDGGQCRVENFERPSVDGIDTEPR